MKAPGVLAHQIARVERARVARRQRDAVRDSRIMLSHGSGGKASYALIESVILEALGTVAAANAEDSAVVRVADPKACQCGEVLKGVLKPWECKVFGTACTPETPIGTCMVSSEGACAAYYNFGRFTRERVKEATRS